MFHYFDFQHNISFIIIHHIFRLLFSLINSGIVEHFILQKVHFKNVNLLHLLKNTLAKTYFR